MDPLKARILQDLLGKSDITLSSDQTEALEAFVRFEKQHAERPAFMLTGSAGTGKTFMIGLFTELLRKSGYKVVLLAPTGRAAKVITRRTRRLAYTIHHHIYSPRELISGDVSFELKTNKEEERTVYVVDEASMIGEESEGLNLLHDLLQYIFLPEGRHKLILVGDPVQLPPVGHADSPALNVKELRKRYDLDVTHAHLTEVKRQLVDSGVLDNAVLIRDAYTESRTSVELETGRDVQVIDSPHEAIETYTGYYEDGNPDRVVFITYSNAFAARVNQAIRNQLLGVPEPLVPSDLVMVVKNNYVWGDPKRMPFLANGEMGIVRYADPEPEERYGLKWMDVELEFQDSRGEPFMVSCKVNLDLLQNKLPQIDRGVMSRIYHERQQEYQGLPRSQAREQLRTDPYLNALQIKYGYAVTGHKAQGGQWENVLIGFERDYGEDPKAYLRWTYTVFTRAESRVFLLNCPFIS